MSNSRLSISRYDDSTSKYYFRASDLFPQQGARTSSSVIDPEESIPRLLHDYKRLFALTQNEQNNLHDVILKVESSHGERILAQKQLLVARSAYFEKEVFSANNTSQHEDYTRISDKQGFVDTITFRSSFCGDFRLLLDVVNYMYWAHWEPTSDLARTKAIYQLAAKLDLKELRDHAGEILAKELKPQNVVDLLLTANAYDGKRLKGKCIDFIIQNKHQIDRREVEQKLLEGNAGKELLLEIYKESVLKSKK